MSDIDAVELKLLDSDLSTVLQIVQGKDPSFYMQLNEAGSGEVTVHLLKDTSDEVIAGRYIQVWYRGALRGGFFIEQVGKIMVDENDAGNRWKTVSGRGDLALLNDAIVWDYLTPGVETVRKFTGVSKADMLATLLDEAKNPQIVGGVTVLDRKCFPMLSWDFTGVLDSNGVAWTDSEDMEFQVGTYLMDVLRQMAQLGIDFKIVPDGVGNYVLSAYKNPLGTDKHLSVIFRRGHNCMRVDENDQMADLKNRILVQFSDPSVPYTNVEDAASQAAYRPRESLLVAANASTAATAAAYGNVELTRLKNPREALVIRANDGASNSLATGQARLFLDYEVGDTVGYDDGDGVIVSHRILGIQMKWPDEGGVAEVTLELDEIVMPIDIRLARQGLHMAGSSVGGSLQIPPIPTRLGGASRADAGTYIPHSLATAANDFLVASGVGAFVKKTLAEVLTIIGKGVANGLATLDANIQVPDAQLYHTYDHHMAGLTNNEHFFALPSWTGWVNDPTGTWGKKTCSNHIGDFQADDATKYSVYYKNVATYSSRQARIMLSVAFNAAGGIHIDDGTLNNYIEWSYGYSALGFLTLRVVTVTGGGAPVVTTLATNLPIGIWGLSITHGSSIWSYIWHETHQIMYTGSAIAPYFTPARLGFFFTKADNGDARGVYIYRWADNFA